MRFHRLLIAAVLLTIVLAGLLLGGRQATTPIQTVRDVLRQNGIPVSTQIPPPLIDAHVDSFAVDSDSRDFVMAFHSPQRPTQDIDSIRIMLLNRPTARWSFGTVSSSDARPPLLGNSIPRVKRTPRHVLVETHVSPSALQTFVLGRDLRLVRALYGWSLAVLPDESIVYRHSMIHFAPTHPVEISIFNPATLRDKKIYPPSPDQPVRTEFIRRVSQAYRKLGEEWFRINNYPSKPEKFDTSLQSKVMTDSSSNSIAFLIQFGPWDPSITMPIDFIEQVVVMCNPTNRINQTQCRERRLSDWRNALGLPQASIDQVLQRAASRPNLIP